MEFSREPGLILGTVALNEAGELREFGVNWALRGSRRTFRFRRDDVQPAMM